MTNHEINKVLAEKIMGWHLVEDYSAGHYYPTGAWLDISDKVQYWTEPWEPAENIAQAFEAAEKIRLFDTAYEGEGIYLHSDILANGNGRIWLVEKFDTDRDDDDWLWEEISRADTPALAICKALVKAASDE